MSGIRPDGFRLPDASHVGKVRLLVSDLDRSIDYYRQTLGLHLHDRSASDATLGSPDAPLIVLHTSPGIGPSRAGAFGLYHFAILLPSRQDLGRLMAHLSHHRVRVGMADHLVSEAIYLSDPDGLGIEVYADRPRATWRHHGLELTMTVDPLDVESLIAAGGRAIWEGAPAGTVMGHVHLHVGDIAEADAFYHRGIGLDKMLWSFPGALFLAAGGYHHHLGTNTWAPGPAAGELESRLLEWELVVPDHAAAASVLKNLRALGYAADDRNGASAVDPWGTPLRIVPATRG